MFSRFILTLLMLLSLSLSAMAERTDSLWVSGRVKDAITNEDLTEAFVFRYRSDGSLIDSIPANRGLMVRNGETVPLAIFGYYVPRRDSTYVFDVKAPGYRTETVTLRVDNIGKREDRRSIPITFMHRAPRQLGEVTVTASKIKFYNKGDTIVYNADAFQLAEGSMLDALIAQLPGVELNDQGQIKVNGRFVESLLLNGRQFFDGNNQLMLENIGAYTVKNIEVYEGQTKLQQWQGDPKGDTQLTMDVKLKREYMRGWLVNLQGGLGTKDRYSLRAFTSMFSPTTTLSFVGNVNNLNDTRKPGKNDTWTPEMMPSGTRIFKTAAFNYDWTSRNEQNNVNGYAEIEETRSNDYSTTARTNFLAGGNTYDNAFSSARNKKLRIETRNYYRFFTESYYFGGMYTGRYAKRDNNSRSISATFNREQSDITAEALEALYSDGSPQRLDAVINRSITRTDGSSHEWEVQAFPHFSYKIPRTSDRVSIEPGIKYKEQKEERWNDYNINYGADPQPAVRKRQFFDNSPNRSLTFMTNADYATNLKFSSRLNLNISLNYEYRFVNTDKDSYMYALDRLADMGVYGTLPAGYVDTFDPDNSYTSRTIENKHTLQPNLLLSGRLKNNNVFDLYISPQFALLHQHFDYWRAGRSYLVSRNNFLTTSRRAAGRLTFRMVPSTDESRRFTFRHVLELSYNLDTKTPDLVHMIDVVNDADPLNIALGNPDLKNESVNTWKLQWTFTPHTRTLNNVLLASYNYTRNALVRGYTYDTSTGVRRNRTYNVDGNHTASLSDNLSLQFGPRQQFSLSNEVSYDYTNYADMIGVNLQDPVKSTVRSSNVSDRIKLGWQLGKQNISLIGYFANRHTTSSREDFSDIDARHMSYGLNGNFRLPYGFGVSTDFTLYTRRGYGVRELDTTDAIWNMRLTYTPRGGRWVFMLDGFDMLHQLSNVNYAINASGRTVTYTNALPRYIMLSLQYRLNIQPKKRR